MKAAFEVIGNGKLVWAVGKTDQEAKKEASKRATEFHGEKIPASYFGVCVATKQMEKACGNPGDKEWYARLVK
jgi:hypothetical protein